MQMDFYIVTLLRMKTLSKHNLVLRNQREKDAVIRVEPGEQFMIETIAPYTTPNLNGPIHIEGVNPGDTLAIHIHDIQLGSEGVMWFGHNKNEYWSGVLRTMTDYPIEKKIPVKNGKIYFSNEISFPANPMVGRIALMNEHIEYDTGDHGGNMDTKELSTESVLFLHDMMGCGKILIGDVHAAMGDGEVCGTGVEIPANIIVSIDVIPETFVHRPIIETATQIIVLATRDTHDEAYTQCIHDMVQYVQKIHGLSFAEANCLVSAVGDLGISSVVARRPTYKMKIDKKYLGGVNIIQNLFF